MNFVKSGVYLQKISEKGIEEEEIDTRDPKERDYEDRLKRLPEFTVDPGFKSLSEQLAENDEIQKRLPGDVTETETDYYGPPKVTEDEAEFLDLIEQKELQNKQLKEEAEREIQLYRESVSQSIYNEPLIPLNDSNKEISYNSNILTSLFEKEHKKTATPKGKSNVIKKQTIIIKKKKEKEENKIKLKRNKINSGLIEDNIIEVKNNIESNSVHDKKGIGYNENGSLKEIKTNHDRLDNSPVNSKKRIKCLVDYDLDE